MDRRKALKNMAMSLGYAVATPTLISIVQSCKTENALEWTPDFFTDQEGFVLTHLVDIIIPKTDTPSATEVQANIFIDRFTDQVMQKEQQDLFKMGMGKFIDKALLDAGKDKAKDLTPKVLEAVLAATLKIPRETQKSHDKEIEKYKEALAEGTAVKLEYNLATYAFAKNLRELTILAYKTSEYVGEKVLVYLPVPGVYVPCGNTEELTGDKAWSL